MVDRSDEQRLEQAILRALDSANAIGPSSAKTLHELRLSPSNTLAALVKTGSVVATTGEPQRYYFSQSRSVFLPRDSVRWSLAALCVVILLVIVLFLRLVTQAG